MKVLPRLRVTLLGFSGSGVPNNVALDCWWGLLKLFGASGIEPSSAR